MAVRNARAALWLGLCTFIAEATGSVPGQGTKIPCRQQGAVKKTKTKKTKTEETQQHQAKHSKS